MSDENNNNSVLGQIMVTVVVALLVGGSSPWWWQEIFSKKTVTPEPTPTPAPAPEPVPTPAPEPVPQRASINIAYQGDSYGCNLPISISIGDQAFYPQGALFQVENIKLGQQRYQINGQINCPIIGSCQVYGEGNIYVTQNISYYVVWQNTSFGQCSALLQSGF